MENFTGEGAYHAFFENRAALVMFNVTSNSTANTCITGMKNRVVVDFVSQEYTYIKEGDGVISLPGGSGERWAILLPQASLPAGEDGSAYSEDYQYTGTRGAVPAISSNGYLFEGINVTVNNAVPPTGAIKGRFTVDASGKQVFFSKGNLQYQALTDTYDADYSSNVLGEYSWGVLEAHGAVLLPAAGIRTYKNVDNMGTKCTYWSTSWYDHQKAYAVSVSSVYLTSGYVPDRDLGHSVRLVYDIE